MFCKLERVYVLPTDYPGCPLCPVSNPGRPQCAVSKKECVPYPLNILDVLCPELVSGGRRRSDRPVPRVLAIGHGAVVHHSVAVSLWHRHHHHHHHHPARPPSLQPRTHRLTDMPGHHHSLYPWTLQHSGWTLNPPADHHSSPL